MGFFKHLGDAFSGKIYKQNILVDNNITKLLKKSQKLPASKFIKHWAFACILSCDVSLNYFLFEKEGEEINAFKKYICHTVNNEFRGEWKPNHLKPWLP